MSPRLTSGPSSPRSGRGARRLLLAALLGVVAPAAVGLATAAPAGAAACGPAPAGKVAVMVVIDTGGASAQHCVIRSERDTGMDALRATGLSVREDGGFICGIGGRPATGCARNQSPDVDSWWYWHGTPGGGWTYSTVGAPWYRLPQRCAVEGWRYGSPQGGRDMRTAPPAVACELPAPSPPATRPPRVAAPAAPPARAPGEVAPAPGAASGERPAGDPGPGAGADRPTPSEDAPAGDVTTTTADVAGTDDGDPPAADVETEVESGTAGPEERADPAGAATGLQTAEEAASSGGGSWVGVAVLVLAVALVGGGAVLRRRR